MTLAQQAAAIIRHARQRYGNPYIEVVRPIAQWSLPAGFAYDQDVDAIRNGAGVVLPNPEDYWTSDFVYIVPTRSSPVQDAAQWQMLLAGGITPVGMLDVWIDGADIQIILDAHSIKVGQRWYTVSNIQQAPAGYPAATGLWARVTLQGRS